MKKESKHNTKDSHQSTKEQKSNTVNKMTVRMYISNNYLKGTLNTDLHHDILKVKDTERILKATREKQN